MRAAVLLPCYNFIYKSLLFTGSSTEINAGRFNAFMPHQIGKQSNIIILFKKILCISMAERVRINHLFIKSIFVSVVFELLRNATGSNPISITVQKQIAGGTVCFLQPFENVKSSRVARSPPFLVPKGGLVNTTS